MIFVAADAGEALTEARRHGGAEEELRAEACAILWLRLFLATDDADFLLRRRIWARRHARCGGCDWFFNQELKNSGRQ